MTSKFSRPARAVPAQTPGTSTVSRRSLLKKGMAAAAGGASVIGGAALAGQTTSGAQTPSSSRQRFRAYVRFGTGASVRELRLLPISPRQVVLRSEAAQICYTTTAQGLGSTDVSQPFIPGHGGVGTVIEIGSKVNRVAVGDRVVVAGTRQCGACYNCLRGRADHCLLTNGGVDPNAPVAEMSDGTKVTGFTPCCSELMVVFEESCVPVFTRVSSVELAMLHDTGLCGLAATMTKVRVEAGTDVVVLGAGPIGLAAIQDARIQGLRKSSRSIRSGIVARRRWLLAPRSRSTPTSRAVNSSSIFRSSVEGRRIDGWPAAATPVQTSSSKQWAATFSRRRRKSDRIRPESCPCSRLGNSAHPSAMSSPRAAAIRPAASSRFRRISGPTQRRVISQGTSLARIRCAIFPVS